MIGQLIWGSTDTKEQLSDSMLKSAPVRPTIDTVAGKVELLVQVKVCGGLENPIAWVPKSCGAGRSEGCPPSSVSSNSMYSSSFSCAVIGADVLHSLGKILPVELLPFSTWYSLYSTRPHWFGVGLEVDGIGVSKTNCITGFATPPMLWFNVNHDCVGAITPV